MLIADLFLREHIHVIEDGALKGLELGVGDTAIFLERGIDRQLLCERFSENLHTATCKKPKEAQ